MPLDFFVELIALNTAQLYPDSFSNGSSNSRMQKGKYRSSILLIADSSLMTMRQSMHYLSFASTLPLRVCPEPLYSKIFCPPVPAYSDRTAQIATLSLRTVEAICRRAFGDSALKVAHPYHVEQLIDKRTKVVGVSVMDPLGVGPITTTWSNVFGGTPTNRIRFLDLINRLAKIKKQMNFKLVAGGAGVWQLLKDDLWKRLGIDHLVFGEGEYVIPKLFSEILDDGEAGESMAYGKAVRPEDVPSIQGATAGYYIEASRGCGRGCKFCAPHVAGDLRMMTYEKLLIDAREQLAYPGNTTKIVRLQSEDTWRLGSTNLEVNIDFILSLYQDLFDLGARQVTFTHATLAPIVSNPEIISKLTRCLREHGQNDHGFQPGIETGSPRLIHKLMPGKIAPFSPDEWPEVVYSAIRLLDKHKWVPLCGLTLGLPGETHEDVQLTIDLINRLRPFNALFIPIFFVPLKMTKLREKQALTSNNLTYKHWELFLQCWKHNLKHMDAIFLFTHQAPSILPRLEIVALIRFLRFAVNLADSLRLRDKKIEQRQWRCHPN